MRVLVTGWPSFLNGEATAGDVLSMDRVRRALVRSGVPCEVVWSQVFRPGSLGLDDADPADPAVTGFDVVLARDTPKGQGRRDLSVTARTEQVPVVGVTFAPGQPEYGERRRHDEVHQRITTWLLEQDCARVPVDTRLDPRQWRNPSTPGQLDSVLCRLDAVLTTRLHGLVLALRLGVPVLAVDPVDGGGKVGAQAAACGWPALVTAGEVLKDGDCLRPWWNWCLSAEGRMLAAQRATGAFGDGEQLVADLLEILHVKPLKDRSNMTGAELPDVDAREQQTSIDDVEDREDDLTQLPTEVDPADAVDQHRGLGGDDTDDYPWD